MFLDLGMHPGPLLAYLMADPELSLQSVLMVTAVIGRARNSRLCRHGGGVQHDGRPLYGAWVDGLGLLRRSSHSGSR